MKKRAKKPEADRSASVYIPPVRVEVHAPEPYDHGGATERCHHCEEVYSVRFDSFAPPTPTLREALRSLEQVLVGSVGLPMRGEVVVSVTRRKSR